MIILSINRTLNCGSFIMHSKIKVVVIKENAVLAISAPKASTVPTNDGICLLNMYELLPLAQLT